MDESRGPWVRHVGEASLLTLGREASFCILSLTPEPLGSSERLSGLLLCPGQSQTLNQVGLDSHPTSILDVTAFTSVSIVCPFPRMTQSLLGHACSIP